MCDFDFWLMCGKLGVVWMVFEIGVLFILVVYWGVQKILLCWLKWFSLFLCKMVDIIIGELFDMLCWVGKKFDVVIVVEVILFVMQVIIVFVEQLCGEMVFVE